MLQLFANHFNHFNGQFSIIRIAYIFFVPSIHENLVIECIYLSELI